MRGRTDAAGSSWIWPITGAPAALVTVSVALRVLVPLADQTAALPSVFTSRSSLRQWVELGVVTQLVPGAKKSMEPSLPVKKYWSVNPASSCELEIVVGFPGVPLGSWSCQTDRLKLQPGGWPGTGPECEQPPWLGVGL